MKIVNWIKEIRRNIKIHRSGDCIKIDDTTILGNAFDIQMEKPYREYECLTIGKECIVNGKFIFEKESGKISIGDRSYIGGGTSLISIDEIKIGNDVIISWGCTIYDHNSHSIYWGERVDDIVNAGKFDNNRNKEHGKNWNVVKHKKIIIKDKVWIGFDVVILKGVTIGEGAVIGARSVVTKDVEPFTVVAGNPAVVVKSIKDERN